MSCAGNVNTQPLTPDQELYYRQQALRFLQVSLASVLNLRCSETTANTNNSTTTAVVEQQPPSTNPAAGGADASAAGGADDTRKATAITTGAGQPSTLDVLLEVVVGNGPVPTVPPVPAKVRYAELPPLSAPPPLAPSDFFIRVHIKR